MELFFTLLITPTLIGLGIMLAIWSSLAKMRPFLAGFVLLLIGVTPLVLVTLLARISPFEPSYGIVIIGPTYGPALLGVVFFIVGLTVGIWRTRKQTIQIFMDLKRGHAA